MSIIRYQTPDLSAWRSLDRWSNLRDEMNSLFEAPFWANTMREAQLFTGWTPALDLYQTNDDVVAVVELPGMRKEDIDLSMQDGILTISGERKEEAAANGEKTARTRTFRRQIPQEHFATHPRRREQGQCHLQRWHPDRHDAEGGRGQAKADPGQRQLTFSLCRSAISKNERTKQNGNFSS